ncbi:class I SAM-dependent methyltransferase [Yersinia canariae]|uniref:class I SAM-dependent methyltransferase n=1 Tax=Yersinia canariae TaxID=2607663 RepID=UPI0011A4E613|nr:class I SAM-dependent methyltransferase [Yersinia canariae]
MKNSFYSSFENKHRGSTDSIKKRLEVYIPFITPLLNIYSTPIAIDLGCGRGEWLSLVQDLGFDAHGVDLDEGMLSYCYDLNLNVENKDILSYLQTIPDESISVVSSFHVIEHIGFDNLKELVKEAFRVLKPGGLLIMETPNAENIIVGTNNFFLDPTHDKPIPSTLLTFLTEYIGFERSKILRLQENKQLYSPENITFLSVLNGVSPDYSVIAQKNAENSILGQFESEFSKEFGLSIDVLAEHYDNNINEKLNKLRNSILESNNEVVQIKDEVVQIKNAHAKLQEDYNKIRKILAPIFWIKSKFNWFYEFLGFK